MCLLKFSSEPGLPNQKSSLVKTGNKVVTDVTANDGAWTFLCATWSSADGSWALYQNALLVDEGKGLSKGETIVGKYGGTFNTCDI